jgi:hypothetical protein
VGFLDIFKASRVPRGARKGSAVIKARPPREEKVVQGTHEVVRPPKLEGPKVPVQDTRIPVGRYALAGAAAGGVAAVALDPKEEPKQVPMRPSGRTTSVGSATTVPSKTVSEAPKAPTRKGSTTPAPKSSPKPSQKATGASKGQGKAMKGKELADFLRLSADSAVRTYMETGKHKYPSKKK